MHSGHCKPISTYSKINVRRLRLADNAATVNLASEHKGCQHVIPTKDATCWNLTCAPDITQLKKMGAKVWHGCPVPGQLQAG